MTHELHLGTADNSRNKGLALAANDQEESECDEEELLIPKPTINAISVEALIISSKSALNGRTRRAKGRKGKQEDNQTKETLTKLTFAKQ